ncbi:Bug family tripartite tricarboxylate transporter substrate binding protein [Microvirga sp. TS319]|uniref:Bug family tripartite tricarboxylate transporter substrate binding protein n=1 Tax=Microvirga sp. TS319 TaxID=3241165 RepID=UPI00351A0B5E
MRRRDFLLLSATTFCVSWSGLCLATGYPYREARVMVGFPPNGPVDIAGRLVSRLLSERLGQPFVVENKPGESGNVATREVVHADPDGYTLLIFGPVNTINAALRTDLGFDFARDIAPVAGLYSVPLLVEVNPSLPITSPEDFLSFARANPGRLKVGYAGRGTPQHFGIELLRWMAGLDLQLLPFVGSAPALQALVAGEVDAMFDPLPSSIGLVRSGKLRPVAVTSSSRSSILPEIPAMAEVVPNYEAGSWFAVGAPQSTSPDVIAVLSRVVQEGLTEAQVRDKIGELGGMPLALSPEQLSIFVNAEIARARKVIEATGILR